MIHTILQGIHATCFFLPDIIMPRLLMSAREKIAKGSPEDAMAHPYSYFTLDNTLTEEEDEVANMYAFQKIFHGQFQVGIILIWGYSGIHDTVIHSLMSSFDPQALPRS